MFFHNKLCIEYMKKFFRNNIITEKQAAYLPKDSTTNQLLYMVHQIKLSWSRKQISHACFLDISRIWSKFSFFWCKIWIRTFSKRAIFLVSLYEKQMSTFAHFLCFSKLKFGVKLCFMCLNIVIILAKHLISDQCVTYW